MRLRTPVLLDGEGNDAPKRGIHRVEVLITRTFRTGNVKKVSSLNKAERDSREKQQ